MRLQPSDRICGPANTDQLRYGAVSIQFHRVLGVGRALWRHVSRRVHSSMENTQQHLLEGSASSVFRSFKMRAVKHANGFSYSLAPASLRQNRRIRCGELGERANFSLVCSSTHMSLGKLCE
eukprot:jgi/Bigna1/79658/fgenesh1_pg.64_\